MPSIAAVGLCRVLLEKRRSEPQVKFGKLFTCTLGTAIVTILTAFCGSLLASSALSQLSYILEIDLYRGVKLMQLIPIALFMLAYLLVYAYEETGAREAVLAHAGQRGEKNRVKRFNAYFGELMQTPMKLGWFLAIVVIAVAAVLAFCLNNFIIANSTIPTGSMQDTIMAGARVFGSRLKYTFGEVERGDIAIFVYGYKCKGCGQSYRETDQGVCPYCGREDKKNSVVYYVKRVIGMPGDHIEIRQTGTADASEFHNIKIGKNADGSSVEVPIGTVYVNGEAITETYLPEPMIVDGQQFPAVDVTVPEGSYYMLGDNRNNSLDARYWGEYNMVARDKMVAKVYFKYWPLTDMGSVN